LEAENNNDHSRQEGEKPESSEPTANILEERESEEIKGEVLMEDRINLADRPTIKKELEILPLSPGPQTDKQAHNQGCRFQKGYETAFQPDRKVQGKLFDVK
jgi:hypothetical protein